MKKIWCLILVCLLLLGTTGCQNEEVFTNTQSSETERTIKKDGILFTTEYSVSDYVENAIIVSKNDGLLYGLLNDKGAEVIPIKYDNLEFMNKANYLNGKNDSIFVLADYENKNIVLDINGKILKESEQKIGIIDYKTEFKTYDTMAVFYEITGNEYIFYDKNFNILKQIPKQFEYDKSINSLRFISDKCFICADKSGMGMILCDFDGNVLKHFEGYTQNVSTDKETNNCILLFNYFQNERKYYQVTINANGTVLEEKEVESIERLTPSKTRGNADKYILYESNGTWKLEDLNGNTLYDERYYAAFTMDGENDGYCLKNEDNQVVVINRNGKMCIDYGVLETTNDESCNMLINNSSKKVTGVFEGKYGIIILTKADTGYDIYYFKAR